MNKLIDNTYMHDIYRCLNHEAYNAKQIKSFLRFIGEIIITDELLYTADKNGPVFPITKTTVNKINDIAGNRYIKYLDLHKQDFEEICSSVASVLKEEFKFINHESYEDAFSSIGPIFEGINPHEEVKKALMNNRKELYMEYSEPISSNFVPYIILRDSIVDEINPYIQDKMIDIKFVQFISIFIRMLSYKRMAELHNLEYISATSRMDNELFNFPVNEYNILRLKDNINKDDIRPYIFKGVSDVVDALIVYCNGEPLEIIKQAFILRRKTEILRKKFSNETNEALLIKNTEINEIQEQLNTVFRKKISNSAGMIIQPNKAIIGFPEKTIKNNLKENWLESKKYNNSIKYFANTFLYADERRKFNIYQRLLKKCSLQYNFNETMSYQSKRDSLDGKTIFIGGDVMIIDNHEQIGVQMTGDNNKIGKMGNVENVGITSSSIISDIDTLINELKNLGDRYIGEVEKLNNAKNEIKRKDDKKALGFLKKLAVKHGL